MPSDRDDRDQGETHDDSDDSDRTSFFSAEEFLVPASALRNAATSMSKVLHPQMAQGSLANDRSHGWHSLELEQSQVLDTPEHYIPNVITEEQDAAHGLRRWHALLEIVHTEAGYVRDLRALVKAGVDPLSALRTCP
jgi:hypothetical protein